MGYCRHPEFRYDTIIIGMQYPINEKLELLKSDLQTTENMRSQNFQAILYLLAENKFLKTVLIGLSAKPLDVLLREGREMIEAEFEINEELHEKMSEVIKKLVGRR